ncbi:hypothetical protein BH11PSE5_BH11PSE5_03430 [soil metagenome]
MSEEHSLRPEHLPSIIEPIALMTTAIENPPGLKVLLRDDRSALQLRAQIYGLRRRLRTRGDERFDGLSVLVDGREVRLIVRTFAPGTMMQGIEQIVPLGLADVPRSIGSRGQSRASILDIIGAIRALT